MRKFNLMICAAVFSLAACNNGADKPAATSDSTATSAAAKPADTAAAAMPDTAAMNKAWNDFKTPGDMHKWLQLTNGTWEAEINQWMDPAAPPMKATGTMVQSSALGGRYVIGKFSSIMFGEPMEGMSITGYDNAKKLFVSNWIDNFGTGIVMMTGTFDEQTKTLNLRGTQTDPLTGKDSNIREEMIIIDKDSYTMNMYGDGFDGKEMKFMEALYKRKK